MAAALYIRKESVMHSTYIFVLYLRVMGVLVQNYQWWGALGYGRLQRTVAFFVVVCLSEILN